MSFFESNYLRAGLLALVLIMPFTALGGGGSSSIPITPTPNFNGAFKQIATAHGGHYNDVPQNHKEFFAMQNWWIFYVNTSGFLAYASSPSGSGTWTNHQIPISDPIGEGTEYAVDNNATEVFIWITPRSLTFNGAFVVGMLSTSGVINFFNQNPFALNYSNTGPETQFWPMNGQYPQEHTGNNIDAVGTCLLEGDIGGVISPGFLINVNQIGVSMNGTGFMQARMQLFNGATSATDVANNAFCHPTGSALFTSNTITLPEGGSLSTPQEVKFLFSPQITGLISSKNYSLIVEIVLRSVGGPKYSVNFQSTNCEFGPCGGTGFKSGIRWNGLTQTWDTAFSAADSDMWFNLYVPGLGSENRISNLSTLAGVFQTMDAEIVYQALTGNVYLFGTFINVTTTTPYYWVSTNPALLSFSAAQKLSPTVAGAINDQLFSAVDLRDGTLYVLYYVFCNPNFNHAPGLLGRTISGLIQGPLENVPVPIGAKTNYCFEQIYSISPGFVIGFFSSTTNNSTFTLSNTWFNTRSSNGVWSTPTLLNFYTGQLGVSVPSFGQEWCTFPVQDASGVTYFVSADPNTSSSFVINLWNYVNYQFVTKSNPLIVRNGGLFTFCPRQVVNQGEFIFAIQNDTVSPNPVKIVDVSLI